MNRIVEQEVMDTQEAAEAYDAMQHGEVDQAFVDRVVALGANDRTFSGCRHRPPHKYPSYLHNIVPIFTSPP